MYLSACLILISLWMLAGMVMMLVSWGIKGGRDPSSWMLLTWPFYILESGLVIVVHLLKKGA